MPMSENIVAEAVRGKRGGDARDAEVVHHIAHLKAVRANGAQRPGGDVVGAVEPVIQPVGGRRPEQVQLVAALVEEDRVVQPVDQPPV